MKTSGYKLKETGSQLTVLLVFAWFLFVVRVLFAQPEVIIDNADQITEEELFPGVDSTLTDTVVIEKTADSDPYLGIVFGRELDFEKAGELRYPFRYGAYVDEVDEGGPADNAGLQEGDIITRFGNEKILYNDQFIRTVEGYSAGEKVDVIIFRDQKIMKTTVTLGHTAKAQQLTVDEDEWDVTTEINIAPKKKKRMVDNANSGILSWDFIFYVPDNAELYEEFLNASLGYSTLLEDRQVNDNTYAGLNMSGFYLRPGDQNNEINIGFFWASNRWNRQKQLSYNSEDYTRRMTHAIDYWGITLDKQATVFNRIVLSGGMLAGMLTSSIDFYQTNPVDSWGQITGKFADQDNNHLSVAKEYYFVQPNISMMVPILGDIGIQLKVGYMYGVPRSSDWKVNSVDGDDSIINSPNTSIGGYTVSFGPAILLN